MKTFVLSAIREVQEYSQKLNNILLLTNYHWVMLDELNGLKTTYFFKENGELIISLNGKVEKAQWEYLDQDSILIDIRKQYYLLRHGFFDENILALKVDGTEEYAVFINELRYNKELNNLNAVINFLNKNFVKKYLEPQFLNDEKLVDKKFIKSGYNLKMGWFREYIITFNNGKSVTIYKKMSNGKYFVYDKNHILLFETKAVCLKYFEKEFDPAIYISSNKEYGL